MKCGFDGAGRPGLSSAYVHGIGVEAKRNQLDGTVSRCLADHCVGPNNPARRDQDSVVISARDQRWEFVEADGEFLDDLEKLKCLEVACRWLTVRSTFSRKLTNQIVEEVERRSPRGVRHSPDLGFRFGDAFCDARSCPLYEVLGSIIQVRDDACLEQGMTLSRGHLFEFGGSHDISGHIVSLQLRSATTWPAIAMSDLR